MNGAETDMKPVLITGGAGFIGSNLAARLLEAGERVLILDDLSRPGVGRNLERLKRRHGGLLQFVEADVCDRPRVRHAVRRAREVFHFAAQVAVTSSVKDPLRDFDANARGTLTLLEETRALEKPPLLVFTSTNKVYGALDDIGLEACCGRYEPVDALLRKNGICEGRPLDFQSPYGCSKGAADQYVIDYSRTFGVPAVVFRMSCIYGPNQLGTEDQGWVAHLISSAIDSAPVTFFGDGMQVRDILYIDDLVDAFLLVRKNASRLEGRAFNIGGGPPNTLSLLELMEEVEGLCGRKPLIRYDSWRPGDQRYYASDTARFRAVTGWSPCVSAQDGVRRLYQWLCSERSGPRAGGAEKHRHEIRQ